MDQSGSEHGLVLPFLISKDLVVSYCHTNKKICEKVIFEEVTCDRKILSVIIVINLNKKNQMKLVREIKERQQFIDNYLGKKDMTFNVDNLMHKRREMNVNA